MAHYRLTLEPDDNGTVLVTSPDLPIVTYGETEAEALAHAKDAVLTLLQSLINNRESIPEWQVGDTAEPIARLPLSMALKTKLHVTMVDAGLTRADLQRRLGWHREQVDRLFRLDHRSRLEQIEEAFGALGKAVWLDVQDAAPVKEAA